MAAELKKQKLGLFLILGIIVSIIAIIVLGGGKFFVKQIKFITFVNCSVQGLEVGSAVKYRGVQVGRVNKISLAKQGDLIRIEMNIQPNYFTETGLVMNGKNQLKQMKTLFKKNVKKGLRSSMELSGITGMRYVELDFMPPGEKDLLVKEYITPEEIYIPSRVSRFERIEDSVNETLNKINQIDFVTIAEEVKALLKSANKVLTNKNIKPAILDLKNTLEIANRVAQRLDIIIDDDMTIKSKTILTNLDNLSENIERLSKKANNAITEKNLKTILTNLDKLITNYNKLANKANKEITNLDIKTLSNNFNQAANKVETATNVLTDSKLEIKKVLYEAEATMKKLNNLLESLLENQ